MAENTTRISELPDNIKMTYNPDEPVQNPTYKPMNIHPNPYGNSVEPDVMPQHATSRPPMLTEEQKQMLTTQEQHVLPSRDIPMDSVSFQNDEAIQANHIPKPKLTNDYIQSYQEFENNNLTQHEFKKQREENVSDLFSDIQMPFFVGMLFFIFQMPLMDSFFNKYFTFLPLYFKDGNLNFYGMLFKSFAFASCFYSINLLVAYLISI